MKLFKGRRRIKTSTRLKRRLRPRRRRSRFFRRSGKANPFMKGFRKGRKNTFGVG